MGVLRERVRVSRNSVVNIAGVIIPAIIAILATPILLTNMGPKGFGLFSIQLALLVIIGVNDFGISRAVTLEAVARGGFQSIFELRRVVLAGTHLITTVAIAVCISGLVVLIVAMTMLPMSIDEQMSWGVLISASAISLVTLPARAALEVQERFGTANVIRIGGSSLLFAAPALVSYLAPTMTATALAMLLSRLVVSAAAVVATYGLFAHSNWSEFSDALRQLVSGRASELHRQLVRRGGWLGGAGIASSTIGYIDRFALGILASTTVIAQYVVAAELVTKMWLITGAVTAAIMPRLASYWQDQEHEKFQKLFWFFVFCQASISMLAHAIFVFFGNKLMETWLGSQFFPDMAKYLAILSVGIAINGISAPNYLILILNRREKYAAIVQFITLPLTLIVSLISARFFGAIGVAWVFTLRLTIDVFIIRALVPYNKHTSKRGIPNSVILSWVFAVLLIYYLGTEFVRL